jgi:recombination protein RecT
MRAVIQVALTGLTLNPELRLGYLVPRKGVVYFTSSYMGKREIIIRTGMVRTLNAVLVYDGEKIIVTEGTHRDLIHERNKNPFQRGPMIGGYWRATLKTGEQDFGLMSKEEIDEIRDMYSESVKSENKKKVDERKTTTWDTNYEDMALKTLINKAFKSLPKTGISDDVLKALEADNELDNAMFEDWKEVVKNKSKNEPDPFEEDGPASPGGKNSTYEDAVIVPTPEILPKEPVAPEAKPASGDSEKQILRAEREGMRDDSGGSQGTLPLTNSLKTQNPK